MRLLLDEHFPPEIAVQLVRRCGHDVTAVVADPALRGNLDRVLLARARQQRRALVTENVKHFVAAHAEAIRANAPHFGIVLTSSRTFRRDADIGMLVRALDALLRARPAEDALVGMIHWLAPADR